MTAEEILKAKGCAVGSFFDTGLDHPRYTEWFTVEDEKGNIVFTSETFVMTH
jgi:hypothetical protein